MFPHSAYEFALRRGRFLVLLAMLFAIALAMSMKQLVQILQTLTQFGTEFLLLVLVVLRMRSGFVLAFRRLRFGGITQGKNMCVALGLLYTWFQTQ